MLNKVKSDGTTLFKSVVCNGASTLHKFSLEQGEIGNGKILADANRDDGGGVNGGVK